MFSLSKPPPPPPFLQNEKEVQFVEEDDISSDDISSDEEVKVSPFLSPEKENVIGSTERALADALSSIRVPKINREWKKCISEIEKVIDKKPSDQEYNNPSSRKRIEQYKDRLGKDLYECKINQKKKEEEDKNLEKMKRQKAQDDFERRFEQKYNLQPKSQQSSSSSFQQQPQAQPEKNAFGVELGDNIKKGEEEEEDKKPEEERKGFFKSIFGDSSDSEDEDDDKKVDEELVKLDKENEVLENKEEIVDAINSYIKSQDPTLTQNIDIRDIKGIDNLLEQYEDLVNNFDKLNDMFQKYKENQKVKNVKNNHLLDEQEETIENLTTVIVKLENKLKSYKRNSEKKFIAQNELHETSLRKKDNAIKRKLKEKETVLRKKLKEKDNESREIHKYMQTLLNEKIDTANKVIIGLTDETSKNIKLEKKYRSKKKTKKKKRK